MKKLDFIAELAKRKGITKTEAKVYYETFLDIVKDELDSNKKCKLQGLGTLTVVANNRPQKVNDLRIRFCPSTTVTKDINR